MTYEFVVFISLQFIRTPFTIALLKVIWDATIIDVALRGNYK